MFRGWPFEQGPEQRRREACGGDRSGGTVMRRTERPRRAEPLGAAGSAV